MCVPAERSFTDAGFYLLIDQEDRSTEVESLKPLREIWVEAFSTAIRPAGGLVGSLPANLMIMQILSRISA